MIPLGVDRPLRRPTLVTPAIIVLTVASYAMLWVYMRLDPEAALRVHLALRLNVGEAFRPWQLLTCTLLHASLLHLGGNMLFLWVFGKAVEDRCGRAGFVALYGFGAAASAGFHALTSLSPAIGASGAVCAIAGAFLILMPRASVRILTLILIIGVFSVPAWWFIGFHIMVDIVMGGIGGGNVARGAHLAGYAFGISIAMLLLWRKILTPEPYDLFTAMRQAKRRREFAAAAEIAKKRDALVRREAIRADSKRDEAILGARAVLSSAIASGDSARIAGPLRTILSDFGEASAVFPRDQQIKMANMLLEAGEYQLASTMLDGFLKRHPEDPEAGAIRVLLGLVNARHLNDPIRAKTLLLEAQAGHLDESQAALARSLLEELG